MYPRLPPAAGSSSSRLASAVKVGQDLYARIAPALAAVAVAKVILNEVGHQLEAEGPKGSAVARAGHIIESVANHLVGGRVTTPAEIDRISNAILLKQRQAAGSGTHAVTRTPIKLPDIN